MANDTRNTILIQCEGARREGIAKAASTIIPGDLLAYDGGELKEHATADGVVGAKNVAIESQLAAPTSTGVTIDTAYTAGDTIYFVTPKPGDILYMWLKTGNNAVKGVSALVSDGAGALKIAAAVDATLIAGAQVGVPAENLNNTSGSNSRLAVEII